MDSQQPLLSICIPTYNRGNFLRIMLQALLPQVAKSSEKVEVLVLDNASTDTTPQIVEVSRELGPFQYVRNVENIGPLRNVLKGPVECATGQYVWVLGDHNLMVPGALKRVVKFLESNTELDVFYTNFRCATFRDHWPESSIGGYDGEFNYWGNQQGHDYRVTEWSELINAKSAVCTQVYAHIVRRSIWKDYWTGKAIGQSYHDSVTTYPHTHMLADVAFKSPSFYMGTPAITIFNGAQSWGDLETRSKVFLRGLPGLIKLFKRRGLTSQRLVGVRRLSQQYAYENSLAGFRGQNSSSTFSLFALLAVAGFQGRYLWTTLCRAFIDAESCWASRFLRRAEIQASRAKRYWFHNCRPARWLRAKSSSE
jgi:glycosyltransferase involved in cell wall biosynthesis